MPQAQPVPEDRPLSNRGRSYESNNTTYIGELMAKEMLDSPSDRSDASGDVNDGAIDHTAALLGFMDDESDDELERCCFSPTASQDVLDSEMIMEKDGEILDDATAKIHDTFTATFSEQCTIDDNEFLENGKQMSNQSRSKNDSTNSNKVNKYLSDDCPFFFFDPRLVANPTEEYGDRKYANRESNRKQAVLKASAMKEKARSAVQAKAKKTADLVSLPQQLMRERKARKQIDNDLEERSQISVASSASTSTARRIYDKMKAHKMGVAIPTMSIRFDGMEHADDVTVRSQMSEASSVKTARRICSRMKLPTIPKMSESKAARRICSEMKMPSIPTAQMKGYLEGLASKNGNLTVIGDTNSIMRRKISNTSGEDSSGIISPSASIDSAHPGFNPSPIMKTFSAASSNNSYVSCIDKDGFLISPTGSMDNTDASTFASDDGHITGVNNDANDFDINRIFSLSSLNSEHETAAEKIMSEKYPEPEAFSRKTAQANERPHLPPLISRNKPHMPLVQHRRTKSEF